MERVCAVYRIILYMASLFSPVGSTFKQPTEVLPGDTHKSSPQLGSIQNLEEEDTFFFLMNLQRLRPRYAKMFYYWKIHYIRSSAKTSCIISGGFPYHINASDQISANRTSL